MEHQGARLVSREDAVHHERVDVHVEIERPAEPLDDRDGAPAPVLHAVQPGATPQPAQHGAHGHADHGPAQIVVPRQLVRHGAVLDHRVRLAGRAFTTAAANMRPSGATS